MVRIITDSTSDLSREQQQALGVEVVPLRVYFGDASYLDGVELDPAAFYAKLAQADALPTTSQINPDVFGAIFEKYLAQGDEVVGIFLSSALSGTCQSAMIAAGMAPGRVHVVDSRNATFGLGLLVAEACRMREQGLGGAEIADRVRALVPRVRLLAVVDTLKYLKMGGRLSAGAAIVGGILGITPVITIQNGRVDAIGKTRGKKAGFAFIAQQIEQAPPDPAYPVAFGHSNSPESLRACMEYFARYQTGDDLVGNIGCIVGAHVGPNATGIAYIH